MYRELPLELAKNYPVWDDPSLIDTKFYKLMDSSYARRSDLKSYGDWAVYAEKFQNIYMAFVVLVSREQMVGVKRQLEKMAERAEIANYENRLTGDANVSVVEKVLKMLKKGMPRDTLYNALNDLINDNIEVPELVGDAPGKCGKTLKQLRRIAKSHNEGI